MKKILFFIATFTIISSAGSYAQNTFAPIGAEWWYGGECYDYDNW